MSNIRVSLGYTVTISLTFPEGERVCLGQDKERCEKKRILNAWKCSFQLRRSLEVCATTTKNMDRKKKAYPFI